MSLDDDIRAARRRGDDALAARLEARARPAGEGFTWRAPDGRTLRLHQMSDAELSECAREVVRLATLRRFSPSERNRDTTHVLGPADELLTITPLRPTNVAPWWRVAVDLPPELGPELVARGLGGVEFLRAYHARVVLETCDECGIKNEPMFRRDQGPFATARGSRRRLQCDGCAAGWEWRCPACWSSPPEVNYYGGGHGWSWVLPNGSGSSSRCLTCARSPYEWVPRTATKPFVTPFIAASTMGRIWADRAKKQLAKGYRGSQPRERCPRCKSAMPPGSSRCSRCP